MYNLQKAKALEILQQIGEQLSVPIHEDCHRFHVEVPETFGAGQIIAYDSAYGLDALIINVKACRHFTLQFSGQMSDPITFYTMCQGYLLVESSSFSFELNPLQSTIHGGFGDTDFVWSFAEDQNVLCMFAYVYKDVFFGKMGCEQLGIPEDLLTVVKDVDGLDTDFLFQEIYHLPLIDTVKDIVEQETTGILNSTFASGKIYENIYLQFLNYKEYEQKEGLRLIKREEQLRAIRNAEQILTSRLQEPPTIVDLSRMVGINQQTLKKGFRQLYGATINQYLNEKRLEQAGILIQAGEMSLREVALAVGYNNPSYFARKFKEKYQVVPRKFNISNNKGSRKNKT